MIHLLITGCSAPPVSPPPVRFIAQPDESDFINYSFGGGELGADGTSIVIQGDGQITYHYTFPYNGTWPQDATTRDHQLSSLETKELFQSLVDNGLFDLTDVDYGGVDVTVTKIMAFIDGHRLEVSIEGFPDESIHGQIKEVISKIHPEREMFD
jgi:hypothetical protein